MWEREKQRRMSKFPGPWMPGDGGGKFSRQAHGGDNGCFLLKLLLEHLFRNARMLIVESKHVSHLKMNSFVICITLCKQFQRTKTLG